MLRVLKYDSTGINIPCDGCQSVVFSAGESAAGAIMRAHFDLIVLMHDISRSFKHRRKNPRGKKSPCLRRRKAEV